MARSKMKTQVQKDREKAKEIIEKFKASGEDFKEFYSKLDEESKQQNERAMCRSILYQIKKYPESFDMDDWHKNEPETYIDFKTVKEFKTACGTAHCIAGHCQIIAAKWYGLEICRIHAESIGRSILPSMMVFFYSSDFIALDKLEKICNGEKT